MFNPNQNKFQNNSFSNIGKNMQMIKPTYDQFIIKPPEKNKTHGRISDIVPIDSRQRDLTYYPRPDNYRINFNKTYKDVVSAELILCQIPNTFYNIYEKNNELIFNSEQNLSDHLKRKNRVQIPLGQYTNQSLINTLNGSKGNLFHNFNKDGQYFNFSRDPDSGKVRIQSNKHFTFNLNYDLSNTQRRCTLGDINKYYESIDYNSVDNTLGFERKMYDSSYNCSCNCNNFTKMFQNDTEFNLYNQKNTNCNNININCNSNNLCQCKELSGIVEDISSSCCESIANSYYIDIADTDECSNILSNYKIGDYLEDKNNNILKILEIIDFERIKVKVIKGSLTKGATVEILKNNTICAPNILHLSALDYIILDIPQFHLLKSNETSTDDKYAIIAIESLTPNTTVNNAWNQLNPIIKYFNPPLASMNFIDIRFLRYDNTPVDFNGANNVFVLKITTLNQPGKYNNSNNF